MSSQFRLKPLVLFLFTAIAATSAQPSSNVLRVVTFNTWLVPFVGKYSAERMNAFCERLKESANSENGWDVVLLQETWSLEEQLRLSTKCGYKHSALSDSEKQSGLVILSRHPIQNVRRMNFTMDKATAKTSWKNFDGEAMAKKGALAVELKLPSNQKIWIVNTHLISRYNDKNTSYEKPRRKQFLELITWIKAEKIPVNQFILGGDFNVAPQGPFHEELWNDMSRLFEETLGVELFQSQFDPLLDCTSCPPNFVAKENEGKIDHLFGSKSVRPREGQVTLVETFKLDSGEQIHLSDHFGWETIFEL